MQKYWKKRNNWQNVIVISRVFFFFCSNKITSGGFFYICVLKAKGEECYCPIFTFCVCVGLIWIIPLTLSSFKSKIRILFFCVQYTFFFLFFFKQWNKVPFFARYHVIFYYAHKGGGKVFFLAFLHIKYLWIIL